MNDLLAALLLGIIEGLTEFLPVSSTGHLLIAERWLGARSDLFNIAIQAGAILAVVLIYWPRLWQLLVGFARKPNRDYALKLILAFGITGALGLLVKKLGFELPDKIAPIAWALLVGGFVMLAAEAIAARRSHLPDADPDAIGWGTAVLVGIAQVVAGVFPGTSRSAAAIFAALLFGRSSRVAATEFAFLVGIPTMFAATGYELLHTLKDGGAAGEDWRALGVAFVVSALTAFAAVKWMLRYIQTHRFTVFSWYRIVLGAALLLWLHAGAVSPAGAAQARAPDTRAEANAGANTADAASRNPTESVFGNAQPDARAVGSSLATDGERAAAVAKFRHDKLCMWAAINRPGFDHAKRVEDLILPPGDNWSVEEYRRGLADIQHAYDELDRAEKECSSFDAAGMRDGRMYETALRAADAGDEEAASCFVGGTFPMSAEAWKRPGVQDRFRADAERLIDQGIRRGDWTMLPMASMAYNPKRLYREYTAQMAAAMGQSPGHALVATAFKSGDLERIYRLSLLQNMGAPKELEYDAGFIRFTATKLSEAQRRAADAWAKEVFARYFHGRGWKGWREQDPCPY